MESPQELIEAATGYLELCMFSDAWETIESVPPEEKTTAEVLDVRLRILTALSQWELGEQIAALLVHAGENEKKTVARFHLARSRVLYQSGQFDDSRKEVRKAVEAWRDVRLEMTDDDLKALFK